MKITSSHISFQADRSYEKKQFSAQTIESVEDRISLTPQSRDRPSRQSQGSFQFEWGGRGASRGMNQKNAFLSRVTDLPAPDLEESVHGDPKLSVMRRMIENLTGKKIKLSNLSEYGNEKSTLRTNQSRFGGESSLNAMLSTRLSRFPPNSSLFSVKSPATLSIRPDGTARQPLQLVDPSDIEIPVRKVRITEVNSFFEAENTSFNSQGVVKTADGREIDFSLNLEMSREYYKEERTQMTSEAVLVDPLVVNFGGGAADLTDVRFKFDLDSDGEEEEIPWLTSGSGFLVLDLNEDGVVNDGSELFGPQSGNGFQDLGKLDDDDNGWIDENDAVFEKLSVWSGDSPEDAKLETLKEAGVGAIYLSNADTLFSVNDAETNETKGQIRRTGIYLSEDGKAGTVQQLDLSV